jgi:hypothetical protein
MTLPVGQISLSQVNTELALPATQVIGMNDAAVRTLAGVGGSGTVISMANLQGKSGSRVVIPLTISANTNNYDIYTNRGPTYQSGTSDITLTINPGVFVGGGAPGAAALSLPNAFSPADTITIINQGVVIGKGGAGGANSLSGSGGGTAFSTQRSVSIDNQGTFAGGGGGGGGGADGVQSRPGKQGGPILRPGGGGGGGAGVNGGAGGPGTGTSFAGTDSAGGAGGTAISPGTPGGTGGGRGAAGVTAGNIGGPAGAYATGTPFITWTQTGTRQGSSS